MYTYEYPRPAVTVDAVIFRKTKARTEVLLIQRGNEPFKGMWALPGGFMDMNETLEESIERELNEETGLTNIPLNQLHAFSTLGRDPRGRTVTVTFWGIIPDADATVTAGDDAKNVGWFDIEKIEKLAFDHQEMIRMAFRRYQITASDLS